MSATRLQRIRSQLRKLHRRRRLLRAGSGVSSLLLAALLILLALFLADWLFEMDRLQRVVALAIGAAALAVAFRRFARPWFGRRESLLELALLVERREGIDSDLVAALQFETPEAPRWGSKELEDAVIDYVAEFGKEMDVLRGFSWSHLARRAGALAGLAAALSAAAAVFPDHAASFLERLLLGSRHYPTRTVIEEISLNGAAVYPRAASVQGPRIPQGRSVLFEVRASGDLPSAGRVELSAPAGGARAAVELKPAPGPEPGPGAGTASYSGQFARLTEGVSYQVFLGDAWTDPAPIEVVPLPAIDVEMEVTPPSYARGREGGAESRGGARQISVVEGSRVAVRARSLGKPLEKVELILGEARHRLRSTEDGGIEWLFDPEKSPLEAVMEPVSFQVQVLDRDGLGLDEPLPCQVRTKPDRPPQVAAGMVSKVVLPAARPTIAYGATDDFGIASLKVRRQVIRGEEKLDLGEENIPIPPSVAPPTLLRGNYTMDLAILKLKKDDQLVIVLEAVDFRGKSPGKSSLGEPISLQITDERGVLAAMMETDEKSARQLEAIIQRQLGIGEAR